VDLLRPLRAAALLAWVALAACGGAGEGPRTEPPVRSAPPRSEVAREDAATSPESDPLPREIETDASSARDAGAGSPARESSQRVVEEGKGHLIAGQPEEAERLFVTATRIDPTNGFAWYWLGRARVDQGHRDEAVGVIEKAETLLGPYPAWRDRARALLADLR
jgi:tetratricopeptide (TPR) repeat protein